MALKRFYRRLQLAVWVLGWLAGACTNAGPDCERVRDAVNARLVACNIPAVLRLDCANADYADGDVEACLAAVRAAACEDVEQTYFDRCQLFGQVKP